MPRSSAIASDEAAVVAPRALGGGWLDMCSRTMLRLPVWLQATLVFIASRFIALGVFAAVVRTQPRSPWTTGPETSLNDFLNFWDSGWYERIVTEGYPSVLPRAATGQVTENPWAFYPLHPLLVRDVQYITGLDYQVISPALSTVFAGLAAIVILALFRMHTTPGRALTALAFVFTFPASPVLSTGYAESLSILLLACCLYLVVDRRYLLALPFVVLMDLSRPVGVAFSFFMLIHLIDRWARRKSDPYPAGEVIRSWTLGVGSCVAALIHPIHAWIVTGEMTAYTDTEAAWTGDSQLFLQWVRQAEALAGPFGIPLLIAVIAMFACAVLSPAGRTMGRVAQQWVAAYGVYLLLFFTPQTSTLRLMLPMFPLAMVMANSRSWTSRFVVLIASIVLQIVWVAYLWRFTPPADLPP